MSQAARRKSLAGLVAHAAQNVKNSAEGIGNHGQPANTIEIECRKVNRAARSLYIRDALIDIIDADIAQPARLGAARLHVGVDRQHAARQAFWRSNHTIVHFTRRLFVHTPTDHCLVEFPRHLRIRGHQFIPDKTLRHRVCSYYGL